MDKKKILLIEDDKDAAYLLKWRLEKQGYGVTNAADGKEGFEQVRTQMPHLVILDLMLPKVDGYWVCNMLKSDKRFMTIPIIVLTARTDKDDMTMAKECGADEYIAKPFEFENLLSKIKGLIGD